jgi:multidrug transporter EmrE-like cation transporter
MQEWLWFLLVIITSVVYLLLLRRWTITYKSYGDRSEWWILLLIIILGLISFYGYYRLISMGDLGMIYGIITGSNIALVTLGSVFFYQERPTALSWIGLSMIIIGVIFLALPW